MNKFKPPKLIGVGKHECVTCNYCALTFAIVHPACPRCAQEWRCRSAIEDRIALWEAHGDSKLASPYSHLTIVGELQTLLRLIK